MARDAVTPPGEGRRISAFHGAPVRRELSELVRLAGPVILSRLGIMIMGLVDTIVVGRYSTKELGYLALGWAPTAVILTTAIGLLMGVQVMSARHIGEGRPEATGGVFRRGLAYAGWMGVAITVILLMAGPVFLRHARLEPDLARGAGVVLMVLALSMPFHLTSTTSTFYLESLSRPKPATLAMWVANLVNLGLNLILVPGAFGLPALGAAGSGIATLLSRAFLAAWLTLYIFKMPDARALGLFGKPIDGPVAARQQRRIGYGTAASYFVESGAFMSMSFFAGWIGGLAVAGWSVILNFAAMVFMVPLGLATATAVLVGRAYGAGDRRGVIRTGVLGFAVCVVVLSVVALGVLIGAPQVAAAYTTDPLLVALVVPALVLCCLFFVADGLQVVAAQALRARGDVLVPTITHTISYAAVMMPLAWWFAFRLNGGLTGIIWAVIVASFVAAGLLLGRFWILSRR
jgi:multidrug resistance protein, MATE family